MTRETQKRNKLLIIAGGTILLVVILVASFVYRSNEIGFAEVAPLFSGMSERPTEDEFLTDVSYQQAFLGSGDTERRELSQQQLASVISSDDSVLQYLAEALGLDAWTNQERYSVTVPEFTELKSINETDTLYLSPETIVSPSEDRRSLGYTGQRKLVVDDEGNVVIGYRRRYQGSYQVFLSELQKIEDGYILVQPNEPLSERTLGITQRVPALTIDGKGIIHVVWYGSDNEEYEERRQILHAQTKGSRSFWERNNIVSYVEGYDSEFDYWQEHPDIVLGDFDDLFVVWEGKDEENGKQQIKFSRSFNGGDEWSEWVNIHPAANYTYSRPTILYTESGVLHVFAYSSSGSPSGATVIQHTYSTNLGTSWQPWQIVSEGSRDARHVSATLINGTPVIAYRSQQTEGGPTQIMYQTVNEFEVSEPRVLAQSDEYQFFPSIAAVEGTDEFCVTWIEEDTSSDFPNEDPTDGDIHFACRDLRTGEGTDVFNLTPEGSHLYPVLPMTIDPERFPIAYYDDEMMDIRLRLLSLSD